MNGNRYSLKVCVALLLAVVLVSAPTQASQTDLREAYGAYQEAAEAGDLHAALPYAQTAYEAALELYGSEDRNTGLLAFNYGYVLSEVGRWEEATGILSQSVAALRSVDVSTDVQMYDALYELGRAQRHIVGANMGDEALREALELCVELFGTQSEESGLVLMELGRPTLQRDASHERTEGRLIVGTRFENVENRQSYLVQAREILLAIPARRSEVAQIDIMRSLHFLRTRRNRESRDLLLGGVEVLRELSYSDDFLVSIYLNWANSQSDRWSIDRKVGELSELMSFAAFRREGSVHFMVRALPEYPIQMLNTRTDGYILVDFTIDEMGRVTDLIVEIEDPVGAMEEAVREAMANWYYIPQIIDGHAVQRDGYRYRFNFQMGERPPFSRGR